MNEPTPTPNRSQAKTLPHPEVLDAKLAYNHETGVIRWLKNPPGRRLPDNVAGRVNSEGYIIIRVGGHEYRGHRLAWKIYYREEPPALLDHRNRIRTDNRICNLRATTPFGNSANLSLSKSNKTGVKGVHWDKRNHQWKAECKLNRKRLPLGLFKTIEGATEAVRAARAKYHGEFANHG